MAKKIILNIILSVFCIHIAVSQEVVVGLQSERIISDYHAKNREYKGLAADTIDLPFFDDFSEISVSPDRDKWSDEFVFINNTYTVDQITTGVATLDALDNTGRLYEAASSFVFEADRLTSQPINLNLASSDSIRLSFYYQPGGLGDVPEENDSLILQFYAPAEGKWYPAWKATGGSYSAFKPVILRIDNARFLRKGFRFRFISFASLSANLSEPSMTGNCDQWNIDYILLDKYRNDEDTVFQDVAFRLNHRSLLNNHEAMPLKQFQKVALQEMGSSIPMHYRNNDVIVRNVTRNFEIWDVYRNSLAKTISAGAINVEPRTNVDDSADLIYTFSTDADSALFRVTSWLITDVFDPKDNDTLVYYQKFGNYFAFDDGTSEGGYGVNGLGSRNAMVAYRFKSFMEDTIRAVQICFNDSYMNANQRAFDLMVWDDIGGMPGNVLYSQEKALVRQGDAINGFYTYVLRDGIMVDDIFYVGWKQITETFLNAGLDINTPHGGKQFYWINGNWFHSGVSGSLMIRPVTGAPLATAINDIPYNRNINILHFYPNPAGDFITIDETEIALTGKIYISIVDLQGREVLKVPLSERIDISSLHEGMYIIIATRNGNPFGHNRLIKTR
jgi:hypothetical protein